MAKEEGIAIVGRAEEISLVNSHFCQLEQCVRKKMTLV